MLVCGKIYVCEECNEKTRVEYVGGARITQVGELNIYAQRYHWQKYGQPNANPDFNGYYLYDIALCSNCYKKNTSKNEKEEEMKHRLMLLVHDISSMKDEAIEELRGEIADYVDSKINSLTLSDIIKIADEEIDAAFNSKHTSVEKKRGIFKQFFHRHIKRNIDEYIFKFILEEDKFNSILSKIEDSLIGEWQELADFFRTDIIKVYCPIEMASPENLNHSIMTDFTVRQPVKETPEIVYYGLLELSLKKINEYMKITTKEIQDLFDSDAVAFYLQKRLLDAITS